ncbi:hypothetical protein MaudCBS49596_005292 [Microsporum audouinii]
MHFIFTLLLCLLVSGGSAQNHVDSKNTASTTGNEYYYDYIMIPLTANFTILDDFDHSVLAIGAGPTGEVVEVKPNNSHDWFIEQLTKYTHIVRDKNSSKFIHFPELKDGAVATLSETTATLFEATIGPNVVYKLKATDAKPEDGPLMWTMEAYSAMDQRLVLKLRKPSGMARQDFVVKKTPIQGN